MYASVRNIDRFDAVVFAKVQGWKYNEPIFIFSLEMVCVDFTFFRFLFIQINYSNISVANKR